MSRAELIAACRRIGARVPAWTQGAGGNVSLKVSEGRETVLWIKASGSRLDAVSETSGLASARLDPLRVALRQIAPGDPDRELAYARTLATHSTGPANARLSMEAGFHAFLPRRWVLHFHSLAAVLMAEAQRTEADRWQRWSSARQRLAFRVVPAEMPGLELSLALGAEPDFDAHILSTHGVVLHSNDERVLDDWLEAERSFCDEWGYRDVLTAIESTTSELQARWVDASAPLKLYFPDTAVFLDRLEPLLEKAPNGGLCLGREAWTTHRDLAEIWLATVILHASLPGLSELPRHIATRIAGLPTEQVRRGEAR